MTALRKAPSTKSAKTPSVQPPVAEMRKKLEESLLDDPKLIKLHGFEAALQTPDERQAVKGIVIPYFDLAGKPLKDFWRYRFLEDPRRGFDRLTSKKAQRYTQPAKKQPRAYLSPSVKWTQAAKDTEATLIVTEGEFKAACACVMGFPTIGLGGVWNFTEKHAQTRELLPDLAQFEWHGRDVVVCYDSDAVHNDQVRKAEFRVAEALGVLGAHVRVARLPSLPDGRKCGIDDFLAHPDYGPDEFQRVLDKAESFAELEALYKLNLELAVVMNPVCYYVKYSHEPGGYLQKLDVGAVRAQRDMAEALATKFIMQQGPKKKDGSPGALVQVPLFLRWYHWEGRTTAKRMSYSPGSPGINGECLNTWGGWGVDPVSDEQLGGKRLDIDPWNKLLDIVFEGAEPEHRLWFERWLAYPFQHPGTKMLSCVVLSSRNHGIGKSFVSEILARIYGRGGDPYVARCLNGNEHVNAGKIDLNALTSGRNDWARGRQFVFGEDVRGTTANESREVRDQLKDAITRTTVRVDEKYMRPIEFEDRCNLMFSTNDPTVFQIDDEDRRFFVIESNADPASNEFYAMLDRWSKSHGPSHLHRHFLEFDLGDMAPNTRPPVTQVKREVADASTTWIDQWCHDLKDSPANILAGPYNMTVYRLYAQEDLLAILDPEDKKHISRSVFGRALRQARVPATWQIRMPDGRQRVLYAPMGTEGLPPMGAVYGKLYLEERGLLPEQTKGMKGGPLAKKYAAKAGA